MWYHNVYFIEPHEEEDAIEEETAVESAENETTEHGEYFMAVHVELE